MCARSLCISAQKRSTACIETSRSVSGIMHNECAFIHIHIYIYIQTTEVYDYLRIDFNNFNTTKSLNNQPLSFNTIESLLFVDLETSPCH